MSGHTLQSPETAAFADFWYDAKAAAGGNLPAKSDLLRPAFTRFMPQVALTEEGDDGIPLYILFGTGLTRDFGRDLTGSTVLDQMTEEAKAQQFEHALAFAEQAAEGTVFGRWNIGRAATNTGRVVEYEGLTLPYYEPARQCVRHMTFAIVLDMLAYSEGEGMTIRYPEIKLEMFDALASRPEWMHLSPQAESVGA